MAIGQRAVRSICQESTALIDPHWLVSEKLQNRERFKRGVYTFSLSYFTRTIHPTELEAVQSNVTDVVPK